MDPGLVGGDFWDVMGLADGRVLVTIGDVAGKGVAAAGTTEAVRSMMRAFASVNAMPAFILRKTSQLLLEQGREDAFVTALAAIVDPATGRVLLASAGHPGPVHLTAAGARIVDPRFGPPLGTFAADYGCIDLLLRPGEYLMLYTDGVTEARRGRELFGEARLVQTVAGLHGAAAQRLAEVVRDAAGEHASRLMDDLQVLVLRRS